MAFGHNKTVDERCTKYAAFTHTLSEGEALAMYICCFFAVIFLLYVNSEIYAYAEKRRASLVDARKLLVETEKDLERGWGWGVNLKKQEEKIGQAEEEYTIGARRCVIATLILLAIAAAFVVMETFAALCIQFCHGEDLMMFVWGSWTLLSVGSVIAMFGALLHTLYEYENPAHPPWNVAMGTPVLVLSGTVFYATRTTIGQFKESAAKYLGTGKTPPATETHEIRRASTIQSAKSLFFPRPDLGVVGYYTTEPDNLPKGAAVIHRGVYVVEFPPSAANSLLPQSHPLTTASSFTTQVATPEGDSREPITPGWST